MSRAGSARARARARATGQGIADDVLHPEWPRPKVPTLSFLGAAGTVTGSRFLIDTPDARVMVDCGLYQGLKELRLRNWAPFPLDPSSIDAVVVTHAHIDHIGYLPRLCREGFRGRAVCTDSTARLAAIVLPDSGHLQEEEADYANRMGFSKHHPALPLYTEADAVRALGQIDAHPFNEWVGLAWGSRFSCGHRVTSWARLRQPSGSPRAGGRCCSPVISAVRTIRYWCHLRRPTVRMWW